jgi:hypothetical protein
LEKSDEEQVRKKGGNGLQKRNIEAGGGEEGKEMPRRKVE